MFITFSEKKISYKVRGSGPAIVFLHGFLESKEIWNGFADALSRQFTIVTIDLPGHGESDVLAENHSMELMADATGAVISHLGISKALFVGHSMGGYVAAAFAQQHEEMMSGIVFFHSHAAPDSGEAKENRRRTINIVKENHAGFIRQFIPELFDQKHVEKYRDDIARLTGIAAAMSEEGIVASLAGMRDRPGSLQMLLLTELPVLFIIGKQDSRMPYNQLMAQAVIPSHSEVLLLEDVGHMGYIEAPDKTLEVIRHFALRFAE